MVDNVIRELDGRDACRMILPVELTVRTHVTQQVCYKTPAFNICQIRNKTGKVKIIPDFQVVNTSVWLSKILYILS